jgi:hypothetical protein
MASSEPSRKRGTEEMPPPPPAEPKEEEPTRPAEPKEVPPPPPAEPEEVPPPPPKEVKRLKPPRRKVARPFLRAPKVDYSDAYFSVKMLYEAWQSLGKLVIHLGGPNTPWSAGDDCDGLRLQGQCLGWEAGERSGPPVYYDDDDDGGLDVSSSGSDYLCLINLFLC